MRNQNQASLLKRTSHLVISMLVTVILFSCGKDDVADPAVNKNEASTSQSSQSNGNSTTDVPYDNTIFVQCANGGAGEWIHLSGVTNIKYQIAWTDHGFMYGYHENTREIVGVGLTTGETFSGTIIINGNVHAVWESEQWVANFSDRVRMNGQNTSFYLVSSYHVMANQDGEIKVTLDKQTAECD